MNEKERLIISHLRKDARTSLVAISHETNIPISTIYDKINRLHKDKVIKKYTALIDFSKLGLHHTAKLILKVDRSQREDLLYFLKKHPAINSIYEINGGKDFLIETIQKDVKEHLAFVELLKEKFMIIELQEFQILGEVEREKFE